MEQAENPDWLKDRMKALSEFRPPEPSCSEGLCHGDGILYKFYTLDGNGQGPVSNCPCRIKRIERQKFEGLITGSQVDPSKTLKSMIPRNKSVIDALDDLRDYGHSSFYFFGDMGTGKTRMAQGTVVRAARMGIPSAFISVPKLLYMTNPKSQDSEKIWKQALTIPFLVLDDIGKERPSSWVMNRLFMLVDERYILWQKKLAHTSFTSQHGLNSTESGDGLEDILDPALVDRIREMCLPIYLKGESFRKERHG